MTIYTLIALFFMSIYIVFILTNNLSRKQHCIAYSIMVVIIILLALIQTDKDSSEKLRFIMLLY